ncbi:sulfotransferase ssu-1-like isoform X3 [Haemaphysalis longicornis]
MTKDKQNGTRHAQNGEGGVARSRRVGSYVFCEHFPEEILRGALGYQHRPGEVYIVTYPKCGTTWMQHIMYNIYSRGEPPPTVGHFFHNMPFLERHGVEALEGLTCPLLAPCAGSHFETLQVHMLPVLRITHQAPAYSFFAISAGAIKTHMLYDKDRICPEAKYVYVLRNPFDCCVSFYHHYKMYPIYGFENGTFEDFLQLFLEGDVDGGDYFDHLFSWYPHRNDSNVLFLRLPRWAQLYLDHSGSRATYKPDKGASMVRKGEVGDWRNHFSEEQAQKMKKKAEEVFKGLDLLTIWKDCLYV